MRQANFIESSVNNLKSKLMLAFVVVAVVLYFFLANVRTTLISLVAIPISFMVTVLVFKYLGLSINTMTLGGLTIAIGELVDDAVVGVENVLRRLKIDRAAHPNKRLGPLELIAKATLEVRSGIVIATVIVVLVLVPLFFLPGIEGRLMQPLAIAYIVAMLASMVVSVTVTPVMAYYLLPQMKSLDHGDTKAQVWLKTHYTVLLQKVLNHPKAWVGAGALAAVLAIAAVPFFPTTFLPPFNEGVALVGLRLNPGTTLSESVRIGAIAEKALAGVPEAEHVGRRSGRAELDEHAEGVHVSELDIKLKRSDRTVEQIYADMRSRIAPLPAAIGLGQPISHRIDHMLTGVRAQIAIKVYGDDLDGLRGQAEALRQRLSAIPGVVDLEVEKQVLTPQIKVQVNYDKALGLGITPAKLLQELQTLIDGERITEVVEGQPISHRIDHMLTGVRAQIAIKVYGDDLDGLRGQAEALRQRLSAIPGVVDLEVEKQVLTPQIKVQVNYDKALGLGITPAKLLQELQTLIDGERITEVVEGNRRFNLVLRLPESSRGLEGLSNMMIDTPGGRVPLSQLASVDESDGPNQISRDDGRRRIVLSANAQGRALSDVVIDLRAAIAETKMPEGYFITLGGQFAAQEESSRLIGLLSLGSVALVFLILYSRYRSAVLAAIIMANIPLALVGAVIGLWISGQPLSIAALVGFITLAGIAIRNGILKVSHYINLCAFEGEDFDTKMLVRGSLERLTPVLMTALVAALALSPLLFEAEMPGTEILHPVAVVIFSGLLTSILLDSFLTPAMVALFGRKPIEALVADSGNESF